MKKDIKLPVGYTRNHKTRGWIVLGLIFSSIIFSSFYNNLNNLREENTSNSLPSFLNKLENSKQETNKVYAKLFTKVKGNIYLLNVPSDTPRASGYILILEDSDLIVAYKSLVNLRKGFVKKYLSFPYIYVQGVELETLVKVLSNVPIKSVIISPNIEFELAITYMQNEGDIKPTLENAISIGAKDFWDKGYMGSNIKVGLIDTGVDLDHPDLKGAVIASKSFINVKYGYDTNETSVNDFYGHGTFIASVIAGRGSNNKEKGTGVAPKAFILNAKVFPSAVRAFATLSGILAALDWLSLGPDGIPSSGDEADIINMSLSSPASIWNPLNEAIKAIVRRGIIVVVAAGNGGEGGLYSMSITSPGDSPYVITVGGSKFNGSDVEKYSSIGPTYLMVSKPDIVAPASGLAAFPHGSYNSLSGTSVATAYVSASIALILEFIQKNDLWPPKRNPTYIRYLILNSSRPIDNYDEMWIGKGFIDLHKALIYLESITKQRESKGLIVQPRKIPIGHIDNYTFFPYGKNVFLGEEIKVNLTLIPFKLENTTVNFTLEGNVSNVINSLEPRSITVKDEITITTLKILVTETGKEGFYKGNIKLKANNSTIASISISFYLKKPKGKLAIWLRISPLVKNFRYGIYRDFMLKMEEMGFQITHLWERLSLQTIGEYKILFAPSAFPYITVETVEGIKIFTPNITKDEIDLLYNFITNGGYFILIESFPIAENIKMANNIIKRFGIEFIDTPLGSLSNPALIRGNTSTYLTAKSQYFYHYGCTLNISQPFINVLAYTSTTPTMVIELIGKGGILVASSYMYFSNLRGEINDYKLSFYERLANMILGDNSSISINSSSPIRGSDVLVNIYLSEFWENAELMINDIIGTKLVSLIKDKNSVFNINLRVAGTSRVVLKMVRNLTSTYRQQIINVYPKNTISPQVYFDYNGTKINVNSDFNISIEIVDDEGLLPLGYQIISINVPDSTINSTIKSSREITVTIYLKYRTLKSLARSNKGIFELEIILELIDIDLNYAKYVIKLYVKPKSDTIIDVIKEPNTLQVLYILITSLLIIIIYYEITKKQKEEPKGKKIIDYKGAFY